MKAIAGVFLLILVTVDYGLAQTDSSPAHLVAKCRVKSWSNTGENVEVNQGLLCLNDHQQVSISTLQPTGLSGTVKAINSTGSPKYLQILVILDDAASGMQSTADSHYYYDANVNYLSDVSARLKNSAGANLLVDCQPLIPALNAKSGVDPKGECPTAPPQPAGP